jgi:hypothetical protein
MDPTSGRLTNDLVPPFPPLFFSTPEQPLVGLTHWSYWPIPLGLQGHKTIFLVLKRGPVAPADMDRIELRDYACDWQNGDLHMLR